MQRRSQLWILGAVALFALVLANLAWLLPTLEELEINAWLLHRALALDVRNQLAAFLNREERALRDGADILNQRPGAHKEIISRLLKENPPIESLALLDPAGRESFKTHRFILIAAEDLRDRSGEELFRAVASGQTYQSKVLISGVLEPLVTLAFPLGPGSGLSALVADINLKFLLEVVRGVQVGEAGRAYVVDREGFIIAHPDVSLVLGRVNVFVRPLIQQALEGREADTRQETFSYRDEAGGEVFAVALPFKATGWAIVVENPREAALASSERIFKVALASFGLELLLVILLIWNYLNLVRSASLVQSERNQREAILVSLYDGVLEYDEKSRVVLMNPKAEELLGVKLAELSGLPITAELPLTRPELRALVEVMFPSLAPFASPAKELPGGRAKVLEIHTSHPELKLLVTLTQVLGEHGQVRGFLKILHDISREELIQRIKSEFVSIAAHQLRTPLSAIKWTLKLLLDGDAGRLTGAQEDFIQKGYMINERMIKLVNDLLSAARIEEGRFGYEFKDTDFTAVTENLVSSFGPLALEKKVELFFKKPARPLPLIYADPEKLALALSNLIDNALKYTPEGGKVKVELRAEKDFAVCSISDSGVGIPRDDQVRVFSKFFRASNVMRMETEGTGLGLFIVRNIIKRHGGEVSFSSEEGQGSTFTFTLPLRKELVPEEEAKGLEKFLEGI